VCGDLAGDKQDVEDRLIKLQVITLIHILGIIGTLFMVAFSNVQFLQDLQELATVQRNYCNLSWITLSPQFVKVFVMFFLSIILVIHLVSFRNLLQKRTVVVSTSCTP